MTEYRVKYSNGQANRSGKADRCGANGFDQFESNDGEAKKWRVSEQKDSTVTEIRTRDERIRIFRANRYTMTAIC